MHLPWLQHVGPFQSSPPHCSYILAQPGELVELVAGGADVEVLSVVELEVEVGPCEVLLLLPPLPLPLSNCHQLKLNSSLLPEPVNFQNRSCVPVAPLMLHVTVVYVCHPPVPGTLQVPTSVPD